MLSLFRITDVSAHCDLPCGVYDPAQARIEAESIKAIIAKVADNDDPDFRTRAILIKEQRSELVKHHLWVLWSDYFKPPHFKKYPELHTLVNQATKLAGASGTKGELDAGQGRRAARQDRRDRQDLRGDQGGLTPAPPPVSAWGSGSQRRPPLRTRVVQGCSGHSGTETTYTSPTPSRVGPAPSPAGRKADSTSPRTRVRRRRR